MILELPLSGKIGVAHMGYHHLTEAERYFISRRMRSGETLRGIALEMGRSASTLSRELRRNSTTHDGAYRPSKAQDYAVARRRRCRRGSRFREEIWSWVRVLLSRKWSPEQIAWGLQASGASKMSWRTIYRYIRRDRAAGGELWKHTRIISKFARKRYRSVDRRGMLTGKRHISERPSEVDKRLRLGHWEGDTVMGADMHHCLLTLVERRSGYAVVKKLEARTMHEATVGLFMALQEHQAKIKTITFDNGTEFHDYKLLEMAYPVKCYFATPYHSWERGSNENFNGLLRQYFPKGMCLSKVTQVECDAVAHELNNRPRKRLGFKTPHQVYHGVRRGVALGVSI